MGKWSNLTNKHFQPGEKPPTRSPWGNNDVFFFETWYPPWWSLIQGEEARLVESLQWTWTGEFKKWFLRPDSDYGGLANTSDIWISLTEVFGQSLRGWIKFMFWKYHFDSTHSENLSSKHKFGRLDFPESQPRFSGFQFFGGLDTFHTLGMCEVSHFVQMFLNHRVLVKWWPSETGVGTSAQGTLMNSP